MDPVSELIEQLERNPDRFRDTGGYERLLDLLRDGYAPDALNEKLGGDSEIVGDLLWTVAELENVAPFASEAVKHLSSRDKGTAAYAMEVVLRGSQDPGQLLAVLERLRSCDPAVCVHAGRILAGEGLARLVEILAALGGAWRTLAEELSRSPIRRDLVPVRREVVEGLISHASRDRQVVGLALVTLACKQDESVADSLTRSTETWIREYGDWLRDQ